MKFLSIYKSLLRDITDGKYHRGDMLPSSDELEKRFQVSKTAVDNALAVLVREGVVRRVRSKGTYVSAEPGQSILDSTRQSRILFMGKGTLHALMDGSFASKAVSGVNDILMKVNKSLHYIALRRIGSAEALAMIDVLKPGGVVLFAVYDKEIISGLKERKMPCVCLDTIDISIPFRQFTSDHQQGAILATRKIHELGHSRLLFLGTRQDRGRHNDPDHEYWAHNIAAEASILKFSNVRFEYLASYKRTTMYRELEALLKNAPQKIGIVCATGSVMRALMAISESKPELFANKEIDTVLFTQYSEREYLAGKPVYQIRWNMREMGQLAMTHLLSQINGENYKAGIHRMGVELY